MTNSSWIGELSPEAFRELKKEYLSTKIIDFRKKYSISSRLCVTLFGKKRNTDYSVVKPDLYQWIYEKIRILREKNWITVKDSKILPGYSLKDRI